MALNKAGLASDILDLMTQMRKETEIDDSKFANALADAIDKFVKTGEVPAGIDRKSIRLNSSHDRQSRMPSSA